MKIIAGLGNPGEKYKNTRHNAGFLALDFILKSSDEFMAARPSKDFESEVFTWQQADRKIIFLKPQTYMNDSGLALKAICNFYKADISADLLVIHDEIDLPFGTTRVTKDSGAAGHNGIKSLIAELCTQNFTRIRIGVESRASRANIPTEAFVLSPFTDEQIDLLNREVFPKVQREIEKFIQT